MEHHEQAPAHQEVSLTEDAEAKVPVSSSTAPEVPAATWAEWAEQKKQEYGTPNDWVEASPTAKYYQTVANDFFSGIGKWGHEKALEWFPSIYNYGDAPPTTQQSKPGDDSKADLSA